MHIQSCWNHWWHTPEVYAVAGILQSEGITDHYLYGASMGAYGAVMLANLLQAKGALALSPQTAVLPDTADFDDRWLPDRRQIRPMFDDRERLREQKDRDLWLFLDPGHYLDKLHLRIARGAADDTGAAWHFIDVPYGDHAVGRPLQRSGALHRILKTITSYGELSEADVLKDARECHKYHPKTLLNSLRQLPAAEAKAQFKLGRDAYFSEDHDDPEVHFMAAEFFLLCGEADLSLKASLRSIQSADVAPHLAMKHARVLRYAEDVTAAIAYMLSYLEKRLDAGVAHQALTIMRGGVYQREAEALERRLRAAKLWSQKFDNLKAAVS